MLRSLALFPLLTLALAAQAPAPKKPKAPAAKPAPKKDSILARINGKPVLESEFMTYLDLAYNPEQRMQIAMADGAMQQVQEQYLQTKLFEAKARKDGLDKKPDFRTKRSLMEMDILVRALFERDGQKLQEKIKVSDEEVKSFYEKNPDKFKTAEMFNARHILVSNKDGQAADAKTLTDEQVKEKLAKVQTALKGGKKFEDVAKDLSEDPGSKDKGGLYENISFGSFMPEFEAAVRAQKIGEVGEPVKTPYGLHLIVVEKLIPSELQAFDVAKGKAQQLATQARQEQVMKEFVDAIKKEIPYMESPTVKAVAAAPGSN